MRNAEGKHAARLRQNERIAHLTSVHQLGLVKIITPCVSQTDNTQALFEEDRQLGRDDPDTPGDRYESDGPSQQRDCINTAAPDAK